MRERPILFAGPLVRAILEGRKTQTRRVVGGHAEQWLRDGLSPEFVARPDNGLSRYGYQGDRLWVRETWARIWDEDCSCHGVFRTLCPHEHIQYRADSGDRYPGQWPDDAGDDFQCPRWKPSIHMLREYSRIDLEVSGVRIERLQLITEADAEAEGVRTFRERFPSFAPEQRVAGLSTAEFPYLTSFVALWDEINGSRGFAWSTNPWVWVISFRRLRP